MRVRFPPIVADYAPWSFTLHVNFQERGTRITRIKKMPILNDWIACHLLYISGHLPRLVEENPASFECGHKMGYKQALIDLEHYLEELEEIQLMPKNLFISDTPEE